METTQKKYYRLLVDGEIIQKDDKVYKDVGFVTDIKAIGYEYKISIHAPFIREIPHQLRETFETIINYVPPVKKN